MALSATLALGQPSAAAATSAGSAEDYAERALRTREYTLNTLAVPAGAVGCERLRALGFRREPGSPLSDTWYDASQMLAESALLRAGAEDDDCVLEKTAAFVQRLERQGGGFYPREDLSSRTPTTRDVFTDDNALIGLALLEARDHADTPAERKTLLTLAQSAARVLTDAGVWDDTFGGGFWWNTVRGGLGEGKPTQTSGLAAQLFLRLYQATGDPDYAEWAERTVDWLDTRLYDEYHRMYRYNLRHESVETREGEYLDERIFSYDQGIMIEVHLLYHQLLDPSGWHLGRARELGAQTQSYFWDPERGGFRLSTESSAIYAAYSAWLSQSYLALHAADGNPAWLQFALQNLDGLENHLRDQQDGGFHQMQARCETPEWAGCDPGAEWTYDPTKLLFSQAWMQRAQALASARLSGRG
jgi:hypothetical protein